MSSINRNERLVRAEFSTLEADMCDECQRWEITEEFFHERKRKYVALCGSCVDHYDIVEL